MVMDAAYIGLDSFHDLFYDKDVIMEKIEGKADSAAAVIHKLLRSPKPEQLYLKYAHDILGVVALLGEVRTHKLSRLVLHAFNISWRRSDACYSMQIPCSCQSS
ncbi:hypothetical protein EJD97_012347 [Solanum chilense]|uniref:Uncharacterized protein n=1 Tax=Solanum chilense TaxID=4083 RepID=A0A6N2BJN2_SOLCI|nr:hypothetical protein EJD97_012347 [Solanum chilense]